MFVIYLSIFAGIIYTGYRLINSKKTWKLPQQAIPSEWKSILHQKVLFYNALNSEEKQHFEYKIQEFLLNCRIVGIKTSVSLEDKILVAASAVIPIFAFKEWRYTTIDEVLIYPNTFNENFETSGSERSVLGMVGNGYMEGKMILSKKALREGFSNETDKKNTAIHEFVHLIDKEDGKIDGIPSILLEKQYCIPWIDMIQKKIQEIEAGDSDINPYGSTNTQEFFAVASEYFFERPKFLKEKHPQLYAQLEQIFDHDMSDRKLSKATTSTGRNDPCPCGSGRKFKKCCLNN